MDDYYDIQCVDRCKYEYCILFVSNAKDSDRVYGSSADGWCNRISDIFQNCTSNGGIFRIDPDAYGTGWNCIMGCSILDDDG